MIIYLIFALILICLFDGVSLARRKLWRELSTLGVLITIAIIIVIAKKFHIPTLVDILHQLFRPIGEVLFRER